MIVWSPWRVVWTELSLMICPPLAGSFASKTLIAPSVQSTESKLAKSRRSLSAFASSSVMTAPTEAVSY
jgi:hypothetical protein